MLTKWMSRIPDDTSLLDIAIPGTHDSATYVLGFNDWVGIASIALVSPVGMAASRALKFAQCQSLNIREQLEAGIRFLDLRVNSAADFPLYHGVMKLFIDLKDPLDEIDRFLEANPTETVLVSIKQEDDADRSDTSGRLKDYLAKRARPMFTEARIPLLKEVRGKAVLINRIYETKDAGIFIYFDDNAVFSKDEKQGDGTKLKFAVQDVYSPDAGIFDSTLTAKKTAIEKGYRDYASGSYALRMSFLTASSAPTRTPGEYADDINPRVKQFLRDWSGGTPWITIMDYVGRYGTGAENPVAAIISTNRLTKDGPSGTRDTLKSGEALAKGESLVSANQAYAARFQKDGNFVVYRTVDDFPLAATGTDGTKADRAALQEDGNFVVYEGTKAVAATMTNGKGPGRLVMQDDGNLVYYDQGGSPRWASETSKFKH